MFTSPFALVLYQKFAPSPTSSAPPRTMLESEPDIVAIGSAIPDLNATHVRAMQRTRPPAALESRHGVCGAQIRL